MYWESASGKDGLGRRVVQRWLCRALAKSSASFGLRKTPRLRAPSLEALCLRGPLPKRSLHGVRAPEYLPELDEVSDAPRPTPFAMGR